MIAGLAGDETAYRKLLGEVAPRLRAQARAGLARAGRPPADAEDIVQETLIALHVKRHTWDPGAAFGPWLRGIARHKLVDALRKRGAHGHVPIDDLTEVLPAPEEDGGMPARDVLRHAERLAPGQRAVIEQIFVKGHDNAGAAGALGMTEVAVRVQLHRALKSLARLINAPTSSGGK
jgi:RNA polymerase sigma-70 factor, ECF subfamily